jgi:hypothetical protein
MHERLDRARPVDEAAATSARVRATEPADGRAPVGAPGLVRPADPRLAHTGAAVTGLMALQRSAGNAAVAALVGGGPSLQRAVEIDEMSSRVSVADAAPVSSGTAAAIGSAVESATGGTGGAASPVTSDGATTTITGGTIHLDAAMTESSGVIRAGTIIADSVVASSYTPGAGNVW